MCDLYAWDASTLASSCLLCWLQARLVQMFAAKELGLDTDMLSYRLRQLTLLLPDLGAPSTWCSSTV